MWYVVCFGSNRTGKEKTYTQVWGLSDTEAGLESRNEDLLSRQVIEQELERKILSIGRCFTSGKKWTKR